MLYNLLDSACLALGSLIGLLFQKKMSEKVKDALMKAMGLCIIFIGLDLVLKGKNIILIIISIALGTLIGEILDIEEKITDFATKIQIRLVKSGNDTFAEAFVTSSILFCAGAMGIIGALNVGLTGNGETLLTKSIIDGVLAAIFTTTLGIGVMFSSISVFVYQALFIFLAGVLSQYLSTPVIDSVCGVGGITIIGIGLNLSAGSQIKAANIAPAIFIPMILSLFGIQ